MKKQYNGRQWLFGYNIPQNIVFCVQQEKRNSHRYGTSEGWVNDDRIFIFGWTIFLWFFQNYSLFLDICCIPIHILPILNSIKISISVFQITVCWKENPKGTQMEIFPQPIRHWTEK